MERIEITTFKIRRSDPTKVKQHFIELHDTYIRQVAEFVANEPVNADEIEGTTTEYHEVYTYINKFAIRSCLVGVDTYFIAPTEAVWGYYQVTIYPNGMSYDFTLFFHTKPEAIAFQTKIEEYISNTKP